MPTSRKSTTALRVVLAVLFSFAAPSFALGLGIGGLPGLASAPILGAVLGWPFVGAACALWALAHHGRQHHLLLAGAVGLLTGAAVGAFLDWGKPFEPLFAGCVLIGVMTGLGVWWIAYGRQDRLPKPIITRPQLSL